MNYSIGEVSDMTGIPISTLRYYDKEGMFPNILRSSGGIRIFTEDEINIIGVIECLKATGMHIKEIKEFLFWCQEGDVSLHKRRKLFYNRLEEVEKQLRKLDQVYHSLKFKCWYYDKAVAAGTENAVKNLPDSEIPADLRKYKI